MNITINNVLSVINDNLVDYTIGINNIDDDLTALGMDSIQFIKLIVTLEEEFEIEIPDEKLLISEMNTANKIINVVFNSYQRKTE